jgi:serine/threonine protein kinase
MGADPAAEEQFGPYLVYERLGVGGMATVHRALERGVEGFERVVALKRLLPHLAEDGSFIKSFVREAKLASLLNHVNIVQIFELGRVGTEYFISMEYIDGRDVRRVLRHARKVTGPPPIHITVGLITQLCDALDYAHSKSDEDGRPMGLVHRDVSPSNLLVTSAGHLKVIDFGIAKAQSAQLRTQTGRVKGKLAYMAPEAVAGKDFDARCDLWAAGVILHELLTARPLFASKNEYQTMLKVQRGDIMPPSTFNQGCPPELDAIVFKALARDPDERFGDAGEFREELLALRKQYQLQTGYRDIAAWLEWAFSLEPPAGFAGNTKEQTGSSMDPEAPYVRNKTPRARNRDEDEAVDMVWGGGEEAASGPLVLDDIPDVSEKHLPRPATVDGPAAEDDDDIPTPAPSHGGRVARPGTAPALDNRPTPRPRDSQPPASRPPTAAPRPRDSQPPAPRPRDSQPPAPRPRDSQPPAPRPRDSQPPAPRPRDSQPPASQPPAPRPRDSQPPAPTRPSQPPQRRSGPTMPTPAAKDGLAEHVETLVGVAAYKEPEDPQDSAPTRTAIPRAPAGDLPDDDLIDTPRLQLSPRSIPPPDKIDDEDDPARTAPRMTPVGLRAPAMPPIREKKPSTLTVGASMVERRQPRSPVWTVLLLLALAGAAATGVTLYMTQGQDTVRAVPEPPATLPMQAKGTVKFNAEPADSEVWLEGKLVHTGLPWSVELEPGVHQVEIHHAGYKAWLTSVELSPREVQTKEKTLEPIATAAPEASLVVSTTPPGLDAVLDGQVLPQRTPIKVSIKVGPHTVAVRQAGVEVWRQNVNAEASVDYEYNPSFTEEKLRERAARAAAKAPPSKTGEPPAKPLEAEPFDVASDAARSEEPALEIKPEPKPERPEPAVERPPTRGLGPPRPAHAPGPSRAAPPATHTPSPTMTPPPPITPPATTTMIVPPPASPSPPPSLSPPPPPSPSSSPPPPPSPPAPSRVAPPAASPTPAPRPAAGPSIVSPTAVTKLSGAVPGLVASKHAELPPVVAAKLCIDPTGHVNSVDVVSKIERVTARDLADALRAWVYAPYKPNGVAVPVCFIVTLRVK